ncbi:MAG: hypothetical protein ACI9TO_001207 [Rickettsiales bacterium]|jgi:hypothetical protein
MPDTLLIIDLDGTIRNTPLYLKTLNQYNTQIGGNETPLYEKPPEGYFISGAVEFLAHAVQKGKVGLATHSTKMLTNDIRQALRNELVKQITTERSLGEDEVKNVVSELLKSNFTAVTKNEIEEMKGGFKENSKGMSPAVTMRIFKNLDLVPENINNILVVGDHSEDFQQAIWANHQLSISTTAVILESPEVKAAIDGMRPKTSSRFGLCSSTAPTHPCVISYDEDHKEGGELYKAKEHSTRAAKKGIKFTECNNYGKVEAIYYEGGKPNTAINIAVGNVAAKLNAGDKGIYH